MTRQHQPLYSYQTQPILTQQVATPMQRTQWGWSTQGKCIHPQSNGIKPRMRNKGVPSRQYKAIAYTLKATTSGLKCKTNGGQSCQHTCIVVRLEDTRQQNQASNAKQSNWGPFCRHTSTVVRPSSIPPPTLALRAEMAAATCPTVNP